MFGSPTKFPGAPNVDWGEQLLSVVATQVIRHLFTASDRVDVKVDCAPPIKLLQGQLDRFQMSGGGLVIRQAFRTEAMEFETDAVSIDFAMLLQGQLVLRQPTQAIARVTLLEADINQAFQAPLVTQKLENLSLDPWPDLPLTTPCESVSFQQIRVNLLPQNRVALQAIAAFAGGPTVPIALQATLSVERRRRLRFLNCQYDSAVLPEGDRPATDALSVAGLSTDALQNLSQMASERLGQLLDGLVDLDRFNLDGVTLRINKLETNGDRLLFNGWAQVDHVPRSTATAAVAAA
ncbi:MAG: DUF2993 domain-containing protein [Oscillatoriales cyanobacterium]|nr:MAG: DUF2993 domain-containing protein [Oscillatoriales cyanobacterium]